MSTIIIKGARIITGDSKSNIFASADLLIENNRIAAIGSVPLKKKALVIDAGGKFVFPGFIQTHVHLTQSLFRNMADELSLLKWLKQKIWKLEAAHDSESSYFSAQLGISELVKSGVTTILDMESVHYAESAFHVVRESGVRAFIGKAMMDKGEDLPAGLKEDTESSLMQSEVLIKQWNGAENGRINYALAPRFALSCSEELLRGVGKLSQKHKLLIHTHSSENKEETARVREMTGMGNVEYFNHLGLAGPHLCLAHCIWLEEKEIAILEQKGIKVLHCPSANLKLGSGTAPACEYIKRGINVSLGSDGAACNNNLNMFQEMKLASFLQKPGHGPEAMNAETIFKMATINGAKALGLEEEIGSIEVGKKADLVLFDPNCINTLPALDKNPYSIIVYSGSQENIQMVIIDGKIVMEYGMMNTIDEMRLVGSIDTIAAEVVERAGI
ncbi:MAG: 5'-deoxyadenosine deaminase, partial [Candidatus Auribacterota bacterium]|nr:5'-deoxyadenosine deaminase [Candidatus Auribacterota bacterium]